ncbi:MAG TPA: MBL fold metallo-hydrolase [Pseudonocardiaceae bacterium]|nr:MBL fold metallo-hydrolase [Pseudonocardiaceae bacterium]
MEVVTIETPPLGDRSYLVHDGEVALVIDPQRDIDRVEAAAREAGVRITHVAETHIHNDYVMGGLTLARQVGASYLLNGADEVAFERDPVAGGDEFRVGSLTVQVIATPGHTQHHLSYLLTHGHEQAVFSGGSLLYGSVGRTDLITPQDTERLTRAQYGSVRALAARVADQAGLYPTHGFGSFCSSGPATGLTRSTIGAQKQDNHALTDPDEDHFVATLIAGLTGYPSYYAHLGPINRKGADPADLTVPTPLTAEELRTRLDGGQWVVDLRDRAAFAHEHLRGTLSFAYSQHFTTFFGWTLPWGDPITLVGTREDVESAIRDLSRIGIDDLRVALGDRPAQLIAGHPLQSYPRTGWAELLAEFHAGREPVILDVRRDDEYASGHLATAVHIPLHDLLERLGEVPRATLWVHCGSGYRASIAASILQRAGHDVVHIDAPWDAVAPTGLPTTR